MNARLVHTRERLQVWVEGRLEVLLELGLQLHLQRTLPTMALSLTLIR